MTTVPSDSSGSDVIERLKLGWREALDLANERQLMLEAAKRDLASERQHRAETDKATKKIIDDIYQATLLLTHEVTIRQAINDCTQYNHTTPSLLEIPPSSSTNSIAPTLNLVLERLKNVISLVSTQDLQLHVTKDEVRRLHSVFVSEKRDREERERIDKEQREYKENEHQNVDGDSRHIHQHHSFNCDSIVEESSTITEDTNTVKKVKKKKITKK